MFDFIKRLFKRVSGQSPQKTATGNLDDIAEANDIEVVKASDYIAEMAEEPMETFADPAPEPENYLLGNLSAARLRHDMQTRKAGIAHWQSGLTKYRPRERRLVVDGANAQDFHYLEAIRTDAQFRQLELESPGRGLELHSVNLFAANSLKGKIIGQYIAQSMHDIKSGAEHDDPTAEQTGLFKQNQERAADWKHPPLHETFAQVEELFEPKIEEQNEESYQRWLLSIAETGSESEEVLCMLVDDPNPDVRFCLAENYNLSPTILAMLTIDDNPYVAHRAKKTLDRLNCSGKVFGHNFGNGKSARRTG